MRPSRTSSACKLPADAALVPVGEPRGFCLVAWGCSARERRIAWRGAYASSGRMRGRCYGSGTPIIPPMAGYRAALRPRAASSQCSTARRSRRSLSAVTAARGSLAYVVRDFLGSSRQDVSRGFSSADPGPAPEGVPPRLQAPKDDLPCVRWLAMRQLRA